MVDARPPVLIYILLDGAPLLARLDSASLGFLVPTVRRPSALTCLALDDIHAMPSSTQPDRFEKERKVIFIYYGS